MLLPGAEHGRRAVRCKRHIGCKAVIDELAAVNPKPSGIFPPSQFSFTSNHPKGGSRCRDHSSRVLLAVQAAPLAAASGTPGHSRFVFRSTHLPLHTIPSNVTLILCNIDDHAQPTPVSGPASGLRAARSRPPATEGFCEFRRRSCRCCTAEGLGESRSQSLGGRDKKDAGRLRGRCPSVRLGWVTRLKLSQMEHCMGRPCPNCT